MSHSTLTRSQLLRLTLETTFNLLKPEATVLLLRNEITGGFEVRDFCARDPQVLDAVVGTPNLEALENAMEKATCILADEKGLESFFRKKPAFGRLRTFFALPLSSQGKLFGFITIYQFEESRVVFEAQKNLLGALATQTASALNDETQFESLRDAFKHTIKVFAHALERKDSYTAGHSDRTCIYASMMADGLKLEAKEHQKLIDASLLHDIGKLSVDLSALHNPGKLSSIEIATFRSHPTFGKELLEPIVFLADLVPLVYHHHENFDGSGYPLGIAGVNIPLGARIIAVADSYDAMTSHRAYRRALTHEQAARELKTNAGRQFDPNLVDVFLDQVHTQLTGRSVIKLIRNLEE